MSGTDGEEGGANVDDAALGEVSWTTRSEPEEGIATVTGAATAVEAEEEGVCLSI